MTGENGIFVADLRDDRDFTDISYSNDTKPRYITYDSVQKKVYWTDNDTKKVYRADTDGGNSEMVIFEGSDGMMYSRIV